MPPLRAHMLSPAHICPHSLWVPVIGFLVFSVVHPKSMRNAQPLLPTLLQGTFCPRSVSRDLVEHQAGPEPPPTHSLSLWLSCLYRPARMVPSITHGLILAPLASSRERDQPASQGESSSPPLWPPPWSSAQLSASLGRPGSGHRLVCFPASGGGEGKREAAGEGERGRKGRGLHL